MIKSYRHITLFIGFAVLAGCTSYNNAPVVEQGSVLEVNQPLVLSSGGTTDSDLLRESSPQVNRPQVNTPEIRSSQPDRRGSVVSRAASAVADTAVNAALNGAVHRVLSGDTLYSIAYQYDLDFRALALANTLRPPYTIFVGQELNLDINNPTATGAGSSTNIGTRVDNSGVARSSAGNASSGGVLRQPIGGAAAEPDWQWPLSGEVLRRFSIETNKGLDISANVGDPVLAASNGEVVYSGSGVQGSGNLVILRHGERYLSAYSHNSEMLVMQGDIVAAGDTIARAGTNSSGTAMLHFEIRRDGQPVDPAVFLPVR